MHSVRSAQVFHPFYGFFLHAERCFFNIFLSQKFSLRGLLLPSEHF